MPARALPSVLVLLMVCACCAAQQVSPVQLTGTPGGRYDQTIPFGRGAVGVRQQIHDDLRGQQLLVSRLGFRRALPVASAGARTLDLALDMGPGNFDLAGSAFVQNYTNTARIQRVVARRRVAFPDWSTTPAGFPTPFDAGLVLDTPYFHDGREALVWELRVFGNSAATGNTAPNYIADAFRDPTSNASSGTQIGTGCMPAGRFVEARGLLTVFGDVVPTPQWRMAPGMNYGPRAAFATLFVGVQEIRATLPGLCSDIYVGQPVAAFPGSTNQGGAFTPTPVTVPFDARLVGLPLVVQGVANDPARPTGLPYLVTSGRRTVVSALPRTSYRIGSLTSTASPLAPTGNYRPFEGMVVEFR